MVITTFIDLKRTTVVYRLAYMKKSGSILSRCPDFVIHYRETGQNLRCISSPFLLCSPFGFAPVCPGITPILPKTVKRPSDRVMTGFSVDLSRKRILYVFGFTRNNAG